LPFLRQPPGFRPATRGPANDEEAMAFQRPQAMTDITFVPLQRVHQLGVTARDHPSARGFFLPCQTNTMGYYYSYEIPYAPGS
jgi:hypothetical protein